MGLARLRRRCLRLLRDVDVPQPFDLETFCAGVSARRGRALYLHPLPAGMDADAPCGLWLATAGADHIFYAHGASLLHQQHIILHEIGHMLCDEATVGAVERDDVWSILLPDLDPATVERVLRRSSYTAPQEQIAEMVATLISERANNRPAPRPTDGVLANLYDALAEPGGGERRDA